MSYETSVISSTVITSTAAVFFWMIFILWFRTFLCFSIASLFTIAAGCAWKKFLNIE